MPRQDDASRLLEFTGNSSPPGRRDRRCGGERSVGSWPRGRRERLIFQGNTWRDISACIRSAVSAEVYSVDSISRNESPIFFSIRNFYYMIIVISHKKNVTNQWYYIYLYLYESVFQLNILIKRCTIVKAIASLIYFHDYFHSRVVRYGTKETSGG